MPTPAVWSQCDACPARPHYRATKGTLDLCLCRHHGLHHMDALITAGFIVSEVKAKVDA